MRDYRKLEIWQIGRTINKETYRITSDFPKSELYGLVSQMRRASISIISNIAEGCGRDSLKEFIQFLKVSFGSVRELESQFYAALDVGFVDEKNFDEIMEKLDMLSKKIWNYIRYLKKEDEK